VARVDLSLPFVVALVLAMGLVTLSSAAPGSEFVRQTAFLIGGLVVCSGLVWLGKKRILKVTPYLYVLSVGLLLVTRVIGSEVNGARSWLQFGPLPAFQPSELAKLGLILALAAVMHERPIRGILDYLRVGGIALVPFALVVAEPDLGSALVLAAVAGGMILIRGVPVRHLVLIVIALAVAIPTVALPNLEEHQKARLVSFLNPAADPQGDGYQVIQSTIAVGSGGLFGKGYRQGTQAQLGFVPYRQTDFIFPVLAEEGGFVASVLLLALFGLLFWRLVAMASECPYDRDQLIIIGVLVLIGFQVVINVGVTLGMAPVTGITLPMVSYGGTSLVSTLMALTVAFVVHRDRYSDW